MIDQFHHRLSEVERSLERGNAAPTLPILDFNNRPQDVIPGQIFIGKNDALYWYDGSVWNFTDVTTFNAIGNFPQDPIEGQIIIGKRDNSLCWYSNGAWHGIAGSFARGNTPIDSVNGQLVVGSNQQLCWRSNDDWYCFSSNTLPATQHYAILKMVQWDYHIWINGIDLVYGSWFTLCDPGVTQDPYVIANGGISGVSPGWHAYAETSFTGAYLWSGYYWTQWIKNWYQDGVLLNDMQGASSYTNLAGSHYTNRTFPGGGKGATVLPNAYQSSDIYQTSGAYGGLNTTHTLEIDLSAYNTLQDNNSNMLSFKLPFNQEAWNPWRGVFPTLQSGSLGPGLSWPTGRNTTGPSGWGLYPNNGAFYKFEGSDANGNVITSGPYQTWGPATSITLPYNDSTNWYHCKFEMTYKGYSIINYPWGVSYG